MLLSAQREELILNVTVFVVRVWEGDYREELILNVTVFVARTCGGATWFNIGISCRTAANCSSESFYKQIIHTFHMTHIHSLRYCIMMLYALRQMTRTLQNRAGCHNGTEHNHVLRK